MRRARRGAPGPCECAAGTDSGSHWPPAARGVPRRPQPAHATPGQQRLEPTPQPFRLAHVVTSGFVASVLVGSELVASGLVPSEPFASELLASGFIISGFVTSGFAASAVTISGFIPSAVTISGFILSA